jgi:ArsR family transcriptional regulator, virulence genes transcriptional regulator
VAMANRTSKPKNKRRSNANGSAAQAGLQRRVYEMQAQICRALANATRMHIMDLLGKRPYTISGLQRELGIPLPNVSVQVTTLKAAGIVRTRKEGKQVFCSLAIPEIKQACHLVHCVLRAQVRNTQKLHI